MAGAFSFNVVRRLGASPRSELFQKGDDDGDHHHDWKEPWPDSSLPER